MMRHLRLITALLILLFAAPAEARRPVPPPKGTPPPPLVTTCARYAAYSLSGSHSVSKIAITVGATQWYFDNYGSRLYRSQPAKVEFGGACGSWAIVRVEAFDRYGTNLLGPMRAILHRSHDRWYGRMLGHTFADPYLRKIGVDTETLMCLHSLGL